jgi:hypothetical protein
MKRFIIVGLAILSSLILISCTAKDAQPEGEIEEPPTVTETSQEVVEIMATKTSTPLPTETPQPTATSTPEREAEVELLETASYFNIAGDFVVFGLIKNVGEVPADFIWVTVTVRDASSTVVATRQTFALINVALPGDIAPFRAYFFDEIPAEVSYEVEIEADVASESALDLDYRDLEILSADGSLTHSGSYYQILGEVRNTGEKVAESVSIRALLFNAEGALIGFDTISTEYAILPPDSTSPFEFMWGEKDMVEFEVDHFELVAEGLVSEQVVVEEPTPESEEIFKLIDVNGFPGLVSFQIVGLLQNTSDYDFDMVSVFVNLRDPAGKLIASDSGLTLIWYVPAGEIVPFEITFTDIPSGEIGSVEAAAQGKIAPATIGITRDFEIVTATGEVNDYGGYEIMGEVKNLSDSHVDRIRLAGVIYNAEGKILGASLAYLDNEILAAGETTGFEITFTRHAEGEVDHFEFYVTGYEIEEE